MNSHSAHCVLVAVVNGDRIVDAGSGVVICHQENSEGWKTFVLTCAHNLKARRRIDLEGFRVKEEQDETKYDSDILVNGCNAQPIADPDQLEKLDLAVLEVRGKIGVPAAWTRPSAKDDLYFATGFVSFFKHEFVPSRVDRLKFRPMGIVTGQGLSIECLKLEKQTGGNWFDKGMSGGPVHDSQGEVLAIARMLDIDRAQPSGGKVTASKIVKRPQTAYAILLTPDVMSMVRQLCNCELSEPPQQSGKPVAQQKASTPPTPPTPLKKSIDANDIQKGRWGSKSKEGPFALTVLNIKQYSRYFLFDLILEAGKDGRLIGPFVFHLHDSYRPGVIWVRKTDGKRAGLFEIGSNGVYTIGVQFRAAIGDHEDWFQLEYDLSHFNDGELKKYKG